MTPDWRIATTALALIAATACTSPGGAESTAGTQAAASNACINPTRIQKQTIVSDQEIRFELSNGETWVNKLPRVCHNLKFQGGFTWEVFGTQVCSNQQTIYVREDGTPCQLGVFTLVPNAA